MSEIKAQKSREQLGSSEFGGRERMDAPEPLQMIFLHGNDSVVLLDIHTEDIFISTKGDNKNLVIRLNWVVRLKENDTRSHTVVRRLS